MHRIFAGGIVAAVLRVGKGPSSEERHQHGSEGPKQALDMTSEACFSSGGTHILIVRRAPLKTVCTEPNYTLGNVQHIEPYGASCVPGSDTTHFGPVTLFPNTPRGAAARGGLRRYIIARRTASSQCSATTHYPRQCGSHGGPYSLAGHSRDRAWLHQAHSVR